MAAKVIARNVQEFHQTDEGQRFQEEHRNTSRLGVLTSPEQFADFVLRHRHIQAYLDIAEQHGASLCSISANTNRSVTRLFFKTGSLRSQQMQFTLVRDALGTNAGNITRSEGMKWDTGFKPDPSFLPMIQTFLKQIATDQQAERLATETGLSIPVAREMITVPWMPFVARNIASQHKISLKNVAISNDGMCRGNAHMQIAEVELVHTDARHVTMCARLADGLLTSYHSISNTRKARPTRFQESNQISVLFRPALERMDDCRQTLVLAGAEVVQTKPWALDLLHHARLCANGLGLVVPLQPLDTDTLQFGLYTSPERGTDFVVTRKGEVHVSNAGYPLAPVHEIRGMAHTIPRHYPLPKTYP